MTLATPRNSSRLLIPIASACVLVALLLLIALPFGLTRLTIPTPGPILLGAAVTTIAMPPIRWSITRLVELNPRWAKAGSYELISIGSRLTPETAPQAMLSQLAETARGSVGGSSARVQSSIGEAESGTRGAAGFTTAVTHRGDEIARITVTTPSGLRPEQEKRLEQLASAVGVVVANAVALGTIERRIAELERIIDQINHRRKEAVTAETAARERVARDVLVGAKPIFRRLRSSVAAADFDLAADTCERLIVFLRDISRAMREA